MSTQQPKIEFYKTREFTAKLIDTFDFLRESWRPMLKYLTYVMLPVGIVLAFFVNHFWNGYLSIIMMMNGSGTNTDYLWFGLTSVAAGLVGLASYAVLQALVYSFIRLYAARPERLHGLGADELKPELMHCLKRSAVLMLTFIVLGVVVLGLFALLAAGGFLAHPAVGILLILLGYGALIAVGLPFSLVVPVYMMEDHITVIDAYRKALRLGFATWGGVFAVTFVIGLVTGVIQTFTMMPWYILSMVNMVFTMQGEVNSSFFGSFVFSFVQYLTCVLQCLGYFLSGVITMVAITVQYGHASDKIDGVGVSRQIDRFEEL